MFKIWRRFSHSPKFMFAMVSALVLLSPLLAYGALLLSRPPRYNLTQPLFSGVSYTRKVRLSPNPQVIHVIEVNLNAPGVKVFVTPENGDSQDMETTAYTVSEFLSQYNLQVAVNASYFSPFFAKTPLYFYPRSGNNVNVQGLAISDGKTYSTGSNGWHVLCILEDNTASILTTPHCPEKTLQAVTGSLIVENYQVTPYLQHTHNSKSSEMPLAPRTAVAIDSKHQKLWLVVVDGRQPFYSEGVSQGELAEILVELGAEKGLMLDGGGSSTMAIEGKWGAKLLNAPFHTRIPMRQRPVGNAIGIYASPKP